MKTIHIVKQPEKAFRPGSDRSRAWRILQAFDGLFVESFVEACRVMEEASGVDGDPSGWIKFFTATGRYENRPGNTNASHRLAEVRVQSRRAPEKKVCPECGHQFQGNGWDGIDAHWKSPRKGHEHIMPYREAWPIIRSGGRPSDHKPAT